MPISSDEFDSLKSHKRQHDFLLRKTKEKLEAMGYKVDCSPNKLLLAVNFGGVPIERLEGVGNPDLIAVKGKEVIACDILVKTYVSEMVEKARKYGKLGKVLFILPLESMDNIMFWSGSELGVSLQGTRVT